MIARKGLVTNVPNDELKKDFALYIKYLPNRDYGPNLHPMQAIMSLNDMRTLRSKVDLMSRSTMKVAEWLQKQHPMIESVAVPRPAEPSAPRAGQQVHVAGRRRARRRNTRQAGQSLRPPDVLLRQGRRREGAASSSTRCSASGARPTWGASRAWRPSPPSRPTSSRARRGASWPRSRRISCASAWAASTPTTSSPISIRRWRRSGREEARHQLVALPEPRSRSDSASSSVKRCVFDAGDAGTGVGEDRRDRRVRLGAGRRRMVGREEHSPCGEGAQLREERPHDRLVRFARAP